MRSWNRKRRKRFDLFSAITIGTALLVILFIGSAISAVMVSGLPCFAETIRSEEILSAFRLSVVTASISTVIVMALALPTAYALTRTDMPFKRLSGLMIELTLSLPYILLGLSLLIIFSSPAGKWLKEQGFPIVRLRVHGDILRIEIEKERFSDFIAMADKITAKMKELGFVYITLDAEGFRSGSMDVHIVK